MTEIIKFIEQQTKINDKIMHVLELQEARVTALEPEVIEPDPEPVEEGKEVTP